MGIQGQREVRQFPEAQGEERHDDEEVECHAPHQVDIALGEAEPNRGR